MTALDSARWASRVVAVAAIGTTFTPTIPPRLREAVSLGALVIGMPHGAADTELIGLAAGTSRTRRWLFTGAYAVTATAATVVIRRGGSRTSQAVLAASALHFAEGELATWASTRPAAARAAAAAFATVLLPAAVTASNRRRGGEPQSGLRLLSNPTAALLSTTAASVGLSGALLARGDREAGLDTALLNLVALIPPPAVGFAAYFGGWHSLRHTARVIDSLVGLGVFGPDIGLVSGTARLTRNTAWAAAVGIIGAAALVAADPEHASDNAFAAVLGLTVPHMVTVALVLARAINVGAVSAEVTEPR